MKKFLLYACLFSVCAPVSGYCAKSALASLSSAELSYYEKIFDYSMEVVKPGETYKWKSYSGSGTITVDKQFASKSGYLCRNFTETFTVQNVNGADKGVGCKRQGNDGWCRLRPDNAQTCAMEDPAHQFSLPGINTPDFVNMGMPDIDTNVNTNTNTDTDGRPNIDTNVNAPNTGNVTAKGVAHSITSNMGKAAGSAVTTSKELFGEFFGR